MVTPSTTSSTFRACASTSRLVPTTSSARWTHLLNVSRYASTSSPSPSTSTSTSSSIPHPSLNNRQRSHNLSARYQILEKSLRGKQALTAERDEMRDTKVGAEISAGGGMASLHPLSSAPSSSVDGEASSQPQTQTDGGRTKKDDKGLVFHGFRVPSEPKPPESDECCMSGCAICVYDLHEESLSSYKDSIKSLRSSLTTLGVDESEWPDQLLPEGKRSSANAGKGGSGMGGSGGESGMAQKQRNVSMSAFEEMEMRLREKAERAKVDPPAQAAPQVQHVQTQSPTPLGNTSESAKESGRLSAGEISRVKRAKLTNKEIVKENMEMVHEAVRWMFLGNR